MNEPLILAQSGTGPLPHPNGWQPLAFEQALTQNGLIASNIQTFVGSHWGYVKPFALGGEFADGVYARFDPQDPPYLGGAGDAMFKADAVEVIRLRSVLDPASSEMIDISPRAMGNNTLGDLFGKCLLGILIFGILGYFWEMIRSPKRPGIS